jgi:Polyketide cyclase / dehydrase and lipid transport
MLLIMDWNRYRFFTTWHLDASVHDVLRVLEDVAAYPLWWPEVRRVEAYDDRTANMVIRSLLPYDLAFVARQSRRDPQAGVLEVSMHGDLEGFSRWTVTPDGSGARAAFEEDVIARKALLRRFAAPARPIFRANHAVMMRSGQRGLRARLADDNVAIRSRPTDDKRSIGE